MEKHAWSAVGQNNWASSIMNVFRKHWRKLLLAVGLFGVIIATPGAILFILEVHSLHQWNAKRLPFQEVAWKANVDADTMDPLRLRMVDDLLEQHNFLGASRAEILNLLGRPEPTDKYRDWDLVYWLGPERGSIRIDSEWLVFKFDNYNRVSAYRVISD
jgi:hypothetical protein